MTVNDLENRIHSLKSLRSFTESRVHKLDNEIIFCEAENDLVIQSIALLNRLSEEEVDNGIKTYITLLEEGLKAIFPDQEVGMVGEVSRKRGKVCLELMTTFKGMDGIEVEGKGTEAFGGAVATIQSLLLRIALILKSELRPILFLDETFPAVDAERVDKLIDFLKTLCERLDMSILCVTHNSALTDRSDRSYHLKKTKKGVKAERKK
jgi:DNA repair exonuclease SbcCD ATPase subunit